MEHMSTEGDGGRDRGKPRTRWLDGIKKACIARSLELGDVKVVCIKREQCRDIANCANGGLNV